jgi:hypothetical protein
MKGEYERGQAKFPGRVMRKNKAKKADRPL